MLNKTQCRMWCDVRDVDLDIMQNVMWCKGCWLRHNTECRMWCDVRDVD